MFGFRTASAVDNSIEQDFLFHEKEIIYPVVANFIYEHEKSQQNSEEIKWSKTLVSMPTFAIKEIEKDRELSGKIQGLLITKTLDRGRKFEEERFLTADSIYTTRTKNLFKVKGLCKASTKKDLRKVFIRINRATSMVSSADCSCPAGKSGYCNHVMALLLELADYSLRGLKKVPEEKACTSVARQWGIPGNKDLPKAPVMSTTTKRQADKQGISSTLYDPRMYVDNERFMQKVKKFKLQIMNIDKRIGFGHCIPHETVEYVNTKYGDFPFGSPIAFHLQPIEDNLHIFSNITKSIDSSIIKTSVSESACNLPFEFLKTANVVVSKNGHFAKKKRSFCSSFRLKTVNL